MHKVRTQLVTWRPCDGRFEWCTPLARSPGSRAAALAEVSSRWARWAGNAVAFLGEMGASMCGPSSFAIIKKIFSVTGRYIRLEMITVLHWKSILGGESAGACFQMLPAPAKRFIADDELSMHIANTLEMMPGYLSQVAATPKYRGIVSKGPELYRVWPMRRCSKNFREEARRRWSPDNLRDLNNSLDDLKSVTKGLDEVGDVKKLMLTMIDSCFVKNTNTEAVAA